MRPFFTEFLGGAGVPAVAAASCPHTQIEDFCSGARFCSLCIPLYSGTASGLFMRPAAARSCAFGCAALRVTVSLQILLVKEPNRICRRSSVNAGLRHLGARPHSLSSAPTKIGNSTTEDNYVPEKVTLIGFLGSNGEARTTPSPGRRGADFSVPPFARNQVSYRRMASTSQHTEWHRLRSLVC